MKRISTDKKGSMTMEAALVLPVFLGLFLTLLFLVKMAGINIVLDHAANETAKQMAASAYPLSFLNEFEDSLVEEYGEGPQIEELKSGVTELSFSALKDGTDAFLEQGDKFDLLTRLLAGKAEKEDINSILTSAKEKAADSAGEALQDGVLDVAKKGLGSFFIGLVKEAYWNIKDRGKYVIAGELMEKHLAGTLIDKDKLKLKVVEFPQGEKEFEACKANPYYVEAGLVPGKDFSRDDVVIQLEYRVELSLPVLGKKEILFRNTAVERGWLRGGNGIITEKAEGIQLEELAQSGERVFVTKTGECYHEGTCRYLRRSKIPIKKDDALDEGYRACKVCKP